MEDYKENSAGRIIKIIAVIGFILDIIVALFLSSSITNAFRNNISGILLFFALVIISGCPTLILYGFGELIENTMQTNNILYRHSAQMKECLNHIENMMNKQTSEQENKPKVKNEEHRIKATDKPTTEVYTEPTRKEAVPRTFESLVELAAQMQSAVEIAKAVETEYGCSDDPDMQKLIQELKEIANMEIIYGKMPRSAMIKIEKYKNRNA